jgi:hypothetical protein
MLNYFIKNKIYFNKMNEYIYIVEKNASKMCHLPSNERQLNIICYSINEDIVEPFLLFMVKKINNFFNFPKLLLPENYEENFNIENSISEIVNDSFIYNGIVCDTFDNYYAVVRIQSPNETENNYFVLATEIINNKKIYNYLFSKEIVNLFLHNPSFYLLINKKTKYAYKLPDVAYKYINTDEINYYLNFNNKTEKFFESCDEYYFFNKSISNSLRHITIVRYALFSGNKIHFENNIELTLGDYEINELLKNDKYKTIIISYLNKNDNYPDILVINYDNFIALSYININE